MHRILDTGHQVILGGTLITAVIDTEKLCPELGNIHLHRTLAGARLTGETALERLQHLVGIVEFFLGVKAVLQPLQQAHGFGLGQLIDIDAFRFE